jgi:hypothetical protein
MNLKIKEITVGLSGVIPVAAYENLRPSYSMTVEPTNGNTPEEIFNYCEQYLKQRFDLQANIAKTDFVAKQYSRIRFYEKDGKKYPSVTSILNWNKEWAIPEANLNLYAARGTIIHELIEEYLVSGKWVEPESIDSLAEEVALLKLADQDKWWEECSHKAFIDKYRGNIKAETFEKEVYNDKELYAGREDILGLYEGKRSIMDIKSGSVHDFRQLAAYAMCEEGIEQLVIFPVGKTDNKCGYMQPKICTTINNEYQEFLKARALFKQQFGI